MQSVKSTWPILHTMPDAYVENNASWKKIILSWTKQYKPEKKIKRTNNTELKE